MNIAIMQPYVFPYIGYFQLINSVDIFVFYNDVNFIKSGWINRNNIQVNGEPSLFTIPLSKSSQFSKINNTNIHHLLYEKWKIKFLNTINLVYKKTAYFNEVYTLIEDVLDRKYQNIGDLAATSILEVSKYIKLNREFVFSSERFDDTKEKQNEERIVDIVNKLNGKVYINALGGQKLYKKEYFQNQSISLKFLETHILPYDQFGLDFISGLSIIDILMFNSIENIDRILASYKLI